MKFMLFSLMTLFFFLFFLLRHFHQFWLLVLYMQLQNVLNWDCNVMKSVLVFNFEIIINVLVFRMPFFICCFSGNCLSSLSFQCLLDIFPSVFDFLSALFGTGFVTALWDVFSSPLPLPSLYDLLNWWIFSSTYMTFGTTFFVVLVVHWMGL